MVKTAKTGWAGKVTPKEGADTTIWLSFPPDQAISGRFFAERSPRVEQNKPICSLALYKDWLYSESTCIDGSKIQDSKRQSKAQMSIVIEKRASVLAMNIVEDFIYLNTSNSLSNLEVHDISVTTYG
ncbi:transducin/WD40 repeat-like superfamily protein [Tanacetum coccineum]